MQLQAWLAQHFFLVPSDGPTTPHFNGSFRKFVGSGGLTPYVIDSTFIDGDEDEEDAVPREVEVCSVWEATARSSNTTQTLTDATPR